MVRFYLFCWIFFCLLFCVLRHRLFSFFSLFRIFIPHCGINPFAFRFTSLSLMCVCMCCEWVFWLVTLCQAPVLYSKHEHMHNWSYKQTVYLPENHQQQQMNDEWKIQNMNLIIKATSQNRGKIAYDFTLCAIYILRCFLSLALVLIALVKW